MKMDFKEIYQKSLSKPEEFWREISDDIFWFKKPTKILNNNKPPFYKWFEDGITNSCYNALDFHIDEGRGDKTALKALDCMRDDHRTVVVDFIPTAENLAKWAFDQVEPHIVSTYGN